MKAKLLITASCLPILVTACTPAPTSNPTPAVSPATSPSATSVPPPAPSTTAAPTPSASSGPQPTPNSATGIVGAWQSPSCGKRKYPRTIQFDAEGTFLGRDLVSPCPKNAACVWSGIVNTNGKFAVQADKINLTIAQPDARPGVAEPFPTTLVIDRATLAPVETSQEGARCVYTRATEADISK